MELVKRLLSRLANSAVAWSWALNSLRLASGLLLLPLLLHQLPKPEFGMYYVFLSVLGLLPIIDFGFSSAIARFVSYAMAGATTLQAYGFTPRAGGAGPPNYALIWEILRTTRKLYGWLAVVGFLVMGVWGTALVHPKVEETLMPNRTWLAWGLTLLAGTLEIYSTWWNTFLYCMDQVRESAAIAFWGQVARLFIASILLLAGGGLSSLPLGSIVGCLLNRWLSRRHCLMLLGQHRGSSKALTPGSLLHVLWPNSWRLGLQLLSNYLRTNANTAICVASFGLLPTAEYGLSVQVMTIAVGIASVWTNVKWPLVGQYRSAENFEALRGTIWPRLWLQLLTVLFLAGAAIVAGPLLLKLIHTDKHMLPSSYLVWLAVGVLLDSHFSFWGTLLSLENRVPTLWPIVVTNVCSLALALGLSHYNKMGLLGLVLAPVVSSSVFNYWYWPREGARSLGTTWFRFMFSRPEAQGGTQPLSKRLN